MPRPARDTHKYARGGALLWSGPELMTGASRLAAQAALRIGAGAVTLVGDPAALRIQAAQLTAIMLAEGDAATFAQRLATDKVRAGCVGPVGGAVGRAVATAALAVNKPVVLDADALTGFADDAAHLGRMVRRLPRAVVLTPHEGEFARLFPALAGRKPERASAAAQMVGTITILKGTNGVIAAPDGRAAVMADTVPWLATAGSGDVLAGFVTGLLAQGMPAFEAACAACWIHARIGARLGIGLIAEDLVGAVVRDVLAEIDAAGVA